MQFLTIESEWKFEGEYPNRSEWKFEGEYPRTKQGELGVEPPSLGNFLILL